MTPHFPAVTSKDMERALKKLGFIIDRSSGSHIVYWREKDKLRTVVPRHTGKEMKRGTVSTILKGIGMTVQEFRELLNK